MADMPSTRAEAKALGAKSYFTGIPCKNGHVAVRTTVNGSCSDCVAIRKAAAYRADPDKVKARVREWAQANPEKARLQSVRFRQNNPASARAAQRKYRATVVDQIREASREWFRKNPDKVKAYNGRRRARRLNQICSCCTVDDFKAVYDLARPWVDEVDHIVPLALGGAHCTWNLQVLTVDEHKVKTQKDAQLIARYKRETARGATA